MRRTLSKVGRHGSPWQEVTDGQVMGGVMKLGKALATGFAEERPTAAEEEPGRTAPAARPAEPGTAEEPVRQPAAASEEVPAAR
ncbi:hypothetical protein ACFXC9_11000 [Streptomyces naganishii]|uniref:hypothetical protein n=1 Tax=Streptomyces naganishii TaxID=285447 RepID=UPI0036C34034